jgi:hypothetical protein
LPSFTGNYAQKKEWTKQAQLLLNRHLTLASRFSSDALAKIICHPVSLVWCQLAYGSSLDLAHVKRLLAAAGYGDISAAHIGRELFTQSRAMVRTSKIQKLFRLFVRKKFDLVPLLAITKQPESDFYAPITLDFNW